MRGASQLVVHYFLMRRMKKLNRPSNQIAFPTGESTYGYVIVTSAFLLMAVMWMAFYSFGIFFKPVLKEFGWTRAVTAGAFFLCSFIQGLLAIAMGALTDRFGPRLVMTLCGFLLAAGYVLMSQLSSLWQLYLFFSIILGIGMGGSFAPLMTLTARWFVRRRGMMTGIVASGTGLGRRYWSSARRCPYFSSRVAHIICRSWPDGLRRHASLYAPAQTGARPYRRRLDRRPGSRYPAGRDQRSRRDQIAEVLDPFLDDLLSGLLRLRYYGSYGAACHGPRLFSGNRGECYCSDRDRMHRGKDSFRQRTRQDREPERLYPRLRDNGLLTLPSRLLHDPAGIVSLCSAVRLRFWSMCYLRVPPRCGDLWTPFPRPPPRHHCVRVYLGGGVGPFMAGYVFDIAQKYQLAFLSLRHSERKQRLSRPDFKALN